MKYLLVIDHIATGGAERILIDYYHHLESHGHEARVFVLSGHRGQSKWTDGIDVVYGSADDEDNILRKTVQQAMLLVRLQRLVRTFCPDVVFSFLEKSNLLSFAVRTKAVRVLTVHNVLSIQYTKVKSPVILSILRSMIRWTYNHCSNVLAVSEQVKEDLIENFGVKESCIHVVNNYVDRANIRQKATEEVTDFEFVEGVKYVVTIGRFSEQKAQWKLIRAFAQYLNDCNSNAHLLLIGNGEYESNLKSLIAGLGVSNRVTILPFNINPYKYMAKADLFVLSSLFEGFPIVLAEASSLRIPFVGSRKAIPQEMFTDKTVWERCVYDTTSLERDFSPTAEYADEKALSKLIKAGLEDLEFRGMILSNTELWESCNMKEKQFECYDSFASTH